MRVREGTRSGRLSWRQFGHLEGELAPEVPLLRLGVAKVEPVIVQPTLADRHDGAGGSPLLGQRHQALEVGLGPALVGIELGGPAPASTIARAADGSHL